MFQAGHWSPLAGAAPAGFGSCRAGGLFLSCRHCCQAISDKKASQTASAAAVAARNQGRRRNGRGSNSRSAPAAEETSSRRRAVRFAGERFDLVIVS
jgi:hypothetical protein